jgi:hypothetical protein
MLDGNPARPARLPPTLPTHGAWFDASMRTGRRIRYRP